MTSFKHYSDKAFAKVNLNFRVTGKLPNGYHQIQSTVTFLPDIYDRIWIKKSKGIKIKAIGKFSKELLKSGGDTLVTNTINILKKKYTIIDNLEIKIEKNIPLGAGLGGGSADAAALTRLILKKYNLKHHKKDIVNILSNIGADIPACFYSSNLKTEGFGNKLTNLKILNKKIWIVLIKPKDFFSTKEIFQRISIPFSKKTTYEYNFSNLINDMNMHDNDLQKVALNFSPSFAQFMSKLPNYNSITKPRMTGSGSTIFVLFQNEIEALDYLDKIRILTRGLWKKISKAYL